MGAAYLGSWALVLKDVAECLEVNSWEGFKEACPHVAAEIAAAEEHVRDQGGGTHHPN